MLSVVGVREAMLDSISPSMRNAIAAGIGLFIAFIGLRNGGLIVRASRHAGDAEPAARVGRRRRVRCGPAHCGGAARSAGSRGAILVGILAAAAVAAAFGKIRYAGVFGLPHISTPAAFRFDLATALNPRWLPFVAVFLFMNVFDTIGSVVGVTQQAGLMRDGKLPQSRTRARRRRRRHGAGRRAGNEHDRDLHRKRRGCVGGRPHRA